MTGPCTSSGLVSASAVISAYPGRLRGLSVGADGTNAATVILYDNASAASGTVLAKVVVDATTTHDEVHIPDDGVVVNNGIYASISGTGAECVVYYDRG